MVSLTFGCMTPLYLIFVNETTEIRIVLVNNVPEAVLLLPTDDGGSQGGKKKTTC